MPPIHTWLWLQLSCQGGPLLLGESLAWEGPGSSHHPVTSSKMATSGVPLEKPWPILAPPNPHQGHSPWSVMSCIFKPPCQVAGLGTLWKKPQLMLTSTPALPPKLLGTCNLHVCKNNKMVISIYLSIITLNVNTLNSQPKDRGWLNGLKIYIYAAYKGLTSELKTYTY